MLDRLKRADIPQELVFGWPRSVLLGDEKQGIAIVKNEIFMQFAQYILNAPLCGEKEEEE